MAGGFAPVIIPRTSRDPKIADRPGLNFPVPGWLHHVEGSHRLVIYVPGATEGSPMTGRHDYAPLAAKLAEQGLSLLLIQMSAAQRTPLAIYDECADDIKSAVTWAKEQGFSDLGLLGISMGGTRVCYFNATYPDPAVKAIVLLATIQSSYLGSIPLWNPEQRARQEALLQRCRDLIAAGQGDDLVDGEVLNQRTVHTARSYLSFFGHLDEMNASTIKFLDRITVPVAVIHSTRDSSAPPAQAQEIYDLLAHVPRRQLVWLENGDHQTLTPGALADKTSLAVADWFAQVMP